MKNSNDTTIEFFTPCLGLEVEEYIRIDNMQGVHHVGRYQWASRVLHNSESVLDCACGAGYGSYMLALANPDAIVTGVDYDQRAIDYAKTHYSAANLFFACGDLVTWQKTDGRSLGVYDAVVSFDTIEHLLHREIALLRISENLSEKGKLILSTPCGHNDTKLNPGWEHHKIEYGYVDLEKLLLKFFRQVLKPDDRSLPNLEFWTDVINAGQHRYLNRLNPVICLDPR